MWRGEATSEFWESIRSSAPCTVWNHSGCLHVPSLPPAITTIVLSPPTFRFILDGVERMRERPIQDLVDGLVQLGVDAKCTLGTGCPPVEVNAKGLPGGKVSLREGCVISKCLQR